MFRKWESFLSRSCDFVLQFVEVKLLLNVLFLVNVLDGYMILLFCWALKMSSGVQLQKWQTSTVCFVTPSLPWFRLLFLFADETLWWVLGTYFDQTWSKSSFLFQWYLTVCLCNTHAHTPDMSLSLREYNTLISLLYSWAHNALITLDKPSLLPVELTVLKVLSHLYHWWQIFFGAIQNFWQWKRK